MAGAVAVFGAASGYAQETTIKMGTMAWEDLTPVSLITKKFLEQEGFTVELSDFSEWGIAYAALTKGDVDILASQINYVAADYFSQTRTGWRRSGSSRTACSSVSLCPPTCRSTRSGS
jgi:glycine betaine/proline transport system substrate-binding protein